MTNHTDPSKEIEIPQKFIEWAEDTSEEPPSDFPGKYYSWFIAAQIRMAEAAYRHLSGSPSPSGWISVEDELPPNIPGELYSKNVLAILDGRLAVMCHTYAGGLDDDAGGYVWANCYGDVNGDAEWDENYKPTHWQPLPAIPGDK
jgi:uncharacterized protein DUF551